MGETTSPGSGPDALRARIVQAYAAGDAVRATALYVNEGVQQPPGRPAVVGRDAIRESYDMLFGRGGMSLRMEPWQTVLGEQEARERGAYRLAAGEQTLLTGKYMAVMARSHDGEWRYVWTTVTPD